MRYVPRYRPVLAAGAVALVGLATASNAQAAFVSVTGDAGVPVPLAQGTPVGLRNMDPSVGVAFLPNEDARYSAAFAGPDGVAVSTTVSCFTTKVPVSRNLGYRGNGVYTIAVSNFAKADRDCSSPTSVEVYVVVLAGSVAIAPPKRRHLTRSANSSSIRPLSLPIGLNPGASSYEVRYAKGGVIGPDGAIAGPSDETYVSSTTGLADFRIREPGTYVAVARASGYAGGARFYTPWSAPVKITAIVPFDLESLRFPDSRGPRYQLRGTLRETSIRGRVSISMARGKKGGKYRSLGRAKISSKGTFTKRFTQRRTGYYRVRIKYSGSKTASRETVVKRIRITRRLTF